MFKGLSQRAQKLLTVQSQDEAKRSGTDQLLPEHVMLALIRAADGTGFSVLQNLKINLISLQLQLEQSLPPPVPERSCSAIFRLPGVSVQCSTRLLSRPRSLRHDFIGTEHILLACIRENQSVTSVFFEKENISIDEVPRDGAGTYGVTRYVARRTTENG